VWQNGYDFCMVAIEVVFEYGGIRAPLTQNYVVSRVRQGEQCMMIVKIETIVGCENI